MEWFGFWIFMSVVVVLLYLDDRDARAKAGEPTHASEDE